MQASAPLFSRLPAELLLRIFEHVADSSKEDCIRLSLVSSWVRQLTMPSLYHTAVLDRDDAITRFQYALHAPPVKPAEEGDTHGPRVHNLWIRPNTDAVDVQKLLSSCTRVRKLAVCDGDLMKFIHGTCSSPKAAQLVITIEGLPYRCGLELTVLQSRHYWTSVQEYQTCQYRSPLCEAVTHLRFGTDFQFDVQSMDGRYPNLTHIAICFGYLPYNDPAMEDEARTYFQRAFDRMPDTLEAFVVISEQHHPCPTAFLRWLNARRQNDRRIYWVRSADLLVEWTEEAGGGETLWARAARETSEWEDSI